MTVQAPAQPTLRIESSPRWIRGFLHGQAEPLVNSKKAILVYGERRLPLYYFPRADVRTDELRKTREEGGVEYYSFSQGERTIDDIAWRHASDGGELAQLREYIGFEWRKIDSWFEEDDEVFVHPRDPYHRVDVMHSSRHIRVEIDGHVIADSKRPSLLFETGLITRYYVPRTDVHHELLEPSSTTSQCPYKGTAQYYSVRAGDKVYQDVIWYYPFPTPESIKIANLLAFYNEKVDIYLDGELQERPSTPRRDARVIS